MGLLIPVIFAAVQLIAVAADVVLLLTLVRLMRRHWVSSRWLAACDSAGRALMDPLLLAIASRLGGLGGVAIAPDTAAWVLLSGLLSVRLCLFGIFHTVGS